MPEPDSGLETWTCSVSPGRFSSSDCWTIGMPEPGAPQKRPQKPFRTWERSTRADHTSWIEVSTCVVVVTVIGTSYGDGRLTPAASTGPGASGPLPWSG